MSLASPRTTTEVTAPVLPPELEKQLARVTELSSLPEVTTRIVEIVEDQKSTAHDMHELVRTDPALATKILKVVNSAFYGLPAQIASLDRAIVMLGLSAVKNIALAASLSRMFRPGRISERYDASDLWSHCLAVGVCGRLLCEPSRMHVEEAFVAGLVHDVGLLVEYQLFPDKFREVVARVERSGEPFLAVERELIGADHQAFGAALAGRWKFPLPLRNAIAYHHTPQALHADAQRFVTIVTIADTICCQNDLGFSHTGASQEVTEDMLLQVGLSEQRAGALLEQLPQRLEEAKSIFTDG
jgi:putative nucleotidyltransferase with HDIG domain